MEYRSAKPNGGSPAPADNAHLPLAVTAKIKNALRLVALDETAERLGLSPGQALADARAMIPALAVEDDEPTADGMLLDKIADWAERYTPLVALDQGGLFLEITGAAHLFGGEAALAADLAARLTAQGFGAEVAIADGPGAAWAAARFASGEKGAPTVVPEGGAAAMLAPLPLAALRLDRETVSALDRVGLKRVGQVIGAPRGPLAARFGIVFIRRLDQALGIEEEAIGPRRPPPVLIAERRFAEPISREEDVAATLFSLAGTLGENLETHGLGARRLELALFRVDGVVERVVVGAAKPLRAPKLVAALFREKFAGLSDEIDAGFGFDMARLSVLDAAPQNPLAMDLTGETFAEADLDGLIDRIGARLGTEHVTRIASRDSHIPERAEAYAIASEEAPRKTTPHAPPESAGNSAPIDRPLRLFARPELVEAVAEVPDGPPVRFRWRRAIYRVARAEGPERIAPEWWREEALTRDYFRVEDAAGHRFWLYREGLYGREITNPRWFLHGVFA
jgi:protein ImuB